MELAVTYDSLRRELGRFLGIGRDYTLWTEDQESDCEDIIASGLREFYFPVSDSGYVWSFLREVGRTRLETDKTIYGLPDDFMGLLSPLTFAASVGNRAVERISDDHMRSMQAREEATGAPVYFSLRVKDGNYFLVVFPSPDKAYELEFQYAIAPVGLSDESPVPRGATLHAEAILEAILAAAEKTLDDTEQVHAKRFAERLAASIAIDKARFG